MLQKCGCNHNTILIAMVKFIQWQWQWVPHLSDSQCKALNPRYTHIKCHVHLQPLPLLSANAQLQSRCHWVTSHSLIRFAARIFRLTRSKVYHVLLNMSKSTIHSNCVCACFFCAPSSYVWLCIVRMSLSILLPLAFFPLTDWGEREKPLYFFLLWPYAALTLFAHVKNKYDTTNGNKKWENRGKYGCFCFLIMK